MKTNLAVLIAIVMGVAGGILNLIYLRDASSSMEEVSFLAIKPGLTVRAGELFKEDHFAKLSIPKNSVGLLGATAEPWASLGAVINTRANRNYDGGEVILHQDIKTPPTELKPGPNEQELWVPVDTRSFVPSLLNPGEYVSFLVPTAALNGAAPAKEKEKEKESNPDEDAGPSPAALAEQTGIEVIGPFRVLAVGNRLGSYDVWKGHNLSQQQENVLTVAVKTEGGQLDPKARKLWKLLQQSASRQAGVMKTKSNEKTN
ncbi:MAG TPA: hypothetical protein VFE24_14165 [Pirellulales bacterium]|jgi:hypothetical protein|nr:hypothetical protein [Pirellulales bacterium]